MSLYQPKCLLSSFESVLMSQTILDLDDVSVSFDGFYALTDLSFSLRPGELRSIIGPNGAGKTTFLDVITGKVRPTKGDVTLRGKSIVGLSEQKISRLGVGRKFQTPRVWENLTVQRNLELTASPSSTSRFTVPWRIHVLAIDLFRDEAKVGLESNGSPSSVFGNEAVPVSKLVTSPREPPTMGSL